VVASLISSMLLIPILGLAGAAWSTVVSGVFQLTLLLLALRRATNRSAAQVSKL